MTTWRNLDSAVDFDVCCSTLQNKDARSFAVRFNTDEAQCVLNLDKRLVASIMNESAPSDSGTRYTRWLNFWTGSDDKDSITAVAKHYGISPRLTSLLCTTQAKPLKQQRASCDECSPLDRNAQSQARISDSDIESLAGYSASSPNDDPGASRLTDFGAVFGDLWHFCSVDRGPDYVYVGFNSLFTVPGTKDSPGADTSKPSGLRLWTSLLLCHDGTVVSIFEQPPQNTPLEHLQFTRRNVINVFHHLSSLHSTASINSLMQISVRPNTSSDHGVTTDADSAALLFYYLFDDWTSTLNLITHRYNPYRDKLGLIRQSMFEKADTDLIRALDLVGRQLTTLELMYKSYALIINRLLKPRTSKQIHDLAMSSSIRAGNLSATPPDLAQEIAMTIIANRPDPTAELPLPALLRFERLLDRIRLYALVEIEECVKQKDSLVLMVNSKCRQYNLAQTLTTS